MPARKGWMARRAEGRHEPWTDRRSADAAEELLVRHVEDVPDGEPAADQVDGVVSAIAIDVEKADDVRGETVGLRVDLGQVAVPVVLHHLEQLVDLFFDLV